MTDRTARRFSRFSIPTRFRPRAGMLVGVVFALLFYAVSPSFVLGAGVPQNLLSVGPVSPGNQAIWVARVIVPTAPAVSIETRVYRREAGKPFTAFGPVLAGRALAMAPRGDQLAVLMESGEWLFLSADSVASARPLPNPKARLLSLAADRDTLYAIARIPGGGAGLNASPSTEDALPVATRPATTRSVSAGTRPVAERGPSDQLCYLIYREGIWQAELDLPSDVATPLDGVSLTLVDGVPILLVRESPNTLRLYRRDKQAWLPIGQSVQPTTILQARMVQGSQRPTVWVSPAVETEPDRLLVFEASPSPTSLPATVPTTLPFWPALRGPSLEVVLSGSASAAPAGRTAVFAFDRYRSITLVGDKLAEQSFDRTTLAPLGDTATITLQTPGAPIFDIVRSVIVSAGMAFAIAASLLRRKKLKELVIDPSTLPLAPVGIRLLAGIIDAIPLLVGIALTVMSPSTDSSPLGASAAPTWVFGFGVYFFTTLLTELFIGRSLGKVICRLRIVSLDGTPVTRGQIVTRNLLRVIDVGLTYLPLLLVPFSPLKQRAGDTAAGTIVVLADPPEAEDAKDAAGDA